MSLRPTVAALDAPAAPRLLDGVPLWRPRGNRLARGLFRLVGWRLVCDGLPARQGVMLVYPHTSNWDFPVGIFAKWILGVPLRFWVKDSLFKLPLFGAWLCWLGGVAVRRDSAHGLVADTAAQLRAARDRDELFWLVAAPEGTRSHAAGWRSGAYHLALQAGVPVGLASFDFPSRTVTLQQFVQLSGDVAADFALLAELYAGKRGKRPTLAAPVKLLERT